VRKDVKGVHYEIISLVFIVSSGHVRMGAKPVRW
jgi:hypothetical protein